MASPLITLNNGAKMPQVGFGLWKVDGQVCADIVYNAIKTGYRLFDGACGMATSLFFLHRPNIDTAREGRATRYRLLTESNSVLFLVGSRQSRG